MVSPLVCRVVRLFFAVFPSSTKLVDLSGHAASARRADKRLSGWIAPRVCHVMTAVLWVAMAVVFPSAAGAQTAHFGWAQITLSTNFGQVLNVAADASGNVFAVDDYNSQVYEIVAVNGSIPASPTIRTLASGSFPYPTGVAVDASGNVYVSDETKGAGNNGGVWELLAVNGRVPDSPTIVQLGSGFRYPEDVAVDASGDVFVADTGNNSIKEMVAFNGSVPTSPTINTLGGGFGFLEPTSVRVDASGNIFVADVVLTGGVQGGVFEIPAASGYATVRTLSTNFLFPHNAEVDASGNVFVADTTAGSQGEGVLDELLAVGGSIPASPTMVIVGSGWMSPLGMAIDGGGNIYVADSNAPAVVELVMSAVDFESVNVGSTSGTKTLTFVFDTGGSGVSPSVLTQGTAGLDFADAGTGTCTANGKSHKYKAGDTCTVNVTFAPKYSGQRQGAVELTAGGNTLATVPVFGMGTGPQIAYSPGTQSNAVTGLNAPEGLAIDASGNIYVAAPNNNSPASLYEYAPNGSGGWTKTATISSALNNPTALAVDGAGNVFACNYGGGVDEYSLVSGVWTKTAAVTSESGDYGLAVDGNKNVYVASLNSNDVREYSLVNGTWTRTATVASGLGGPFGIAVDGSGDVFVVDNGNTALLEYSLVNGVWKKTATIAAGLNYPLNVAVDAAGSVYVTTGSAVSEYGLVASTWTNVATLGTGLTFPEGVALDGSGNIFITDWSTGNLVEVNRVTAPSLSFAATNVGSTSTDSPRTVGVENIGNAALNFTALSYPADFPEEAGGTNPCTGTTSLSPVGTCKLNVGFTPQNAGSPLTEDVTLTDNALNVTGAQQSIQVSGVAQSVLSVTADAISAVAGSPFSGLVATIADAPNTDPVSNFTATIDWGDGTPATVGTISQPGGAGTGYLVSGSHTYVSAGSYTITVTVTPTQGSAASGTNTASVSSAPATHFTIIPLSVSLAGTPFTISVSAQTASNSIATGYTGTVQFTSTDVAAVRPANYTFTSGNNGVHTFNVTLNTPGDQTITATDTVASSITGTSGGIAVAVPVPGGSNQGVNFGSQAVGSTSAARTLDFAIASGTTVGSIGVLTQGATGLAFANAAASTCTATTYSSTTDCTVNVTFAPASSGYFIGAVVFFDGNGNPLATVPLSGTGVAPQANFLPGTVSTLGSGFEFPFRVAVDSSGDVFVSDSGHNEVKEIVAVNGTIPASPTILTLASGLNGPAGLAVDGSGNVYFADGLNQAVKEIEAVGGAIPASPTIRTLSTDFNNPDGVAVDASGNVFVSDASGPIKEIEAVGGIIPASPTLITVASFGNNPQGLALDSSGDIFVVIYPNTAVSEIVAVNGSIPASPTILTLGSGLSGASGIAVGANGSLFIADTNNTVVKEFVAVGGSVPASPTILTLGSGFNTPGGVALDGKGNVFVADILNSAVKEIDLVDPPSLSFASTSVGSTSSDSPRTVEVQNAGNAALTFTGLDYPADFPEGSGGADPCTGTTSLGAGGLCNLNIDFTPKNAGSPLSEVVTLTDNSLNVGGAQQPIQVSGTAAAPPTLTKAFGAVSISQGATTTLTFTVANPNTTALTGIAFTDTLPAGLTVATPNGLTGSCSSGTITATLGSGIISLTGATLASSAACTFAVNVVATSAGTKVNVTSPVSSNEGGTGSVATATLSIVSITLSPSAGPLPGGTVGTTYSQQFAATSGSAPYAYTVTAGALPAGLTLSNASGLFSGTPTAGGSFSFTVQAKDSNSAAVSQAYTLNIASPVLTVAPATLPPGTFGASYSQTITASGGTASYSYQVTAGALPSGLSLSLGGLLTGTPVASGSFPFTVTATDSSTGTGPYAGSSNYTLTISKAAATVTLGNLAQAYTGSPLAATATTTPAGLAVTLTYNGSASAPIAVGRYTVLATVNDPNYTGTATGTLVINPASQTISFSSSTLAYASGVTFGVTPLPLSATSTSGLSVTFSLVSGPANLSGNILTITGAGSVVIAANQAGNSDYSAAPQLTETITVNQALPAAALVSSINPVLVQNGITLTATITSGAGMPTGTVTFVDGTTPIGTGILVGGVATLNTSSLAVGTHSISVVYGGDQNFMAVTSSPLTELVEDFSFNISAPAVTVLPGGTAVFNFTVTPIRATTFPANITLSASGAPEGATYAFSPAALTAGEGATTVTLTIDLPMTQAAADNMHPGIRLAKNDRGARRSNLVGRLAPLSLALILLPFAGRLRRAGRLLGRTLSAVLLLVTGIAAVAGISGCGSSNGFFAQQQQTYSVTITGTAGALTHSATVSLTVE